MAVHDAPGGASDKTAAPAGPARAFFRPGGFSLHAGQAVPENQRVRRLALVFARELLRGWLARLFAAGFLFPAIGVGIYAYVRPKLGAVQPGAETAFLLENFAFLFKVQLGALLLAAAAKIAPLIARDAWSGALLLYFSRPVLRSHYLQARVAATAGVAFVLLAVPALLLLLVHLSTFGIRLGGAPGPEWFAPLLWPVLALAIVSASLAIALVTSLVALACGVIVRSPSTAPLLLGGGVLGSLVLSSILQSAMGHESIARSVNLPFGLSSFFELVVMPLISGPIARAELVQRLAGVALWIGLAVGSGVLLRRFLANPPLGKGRA